MSLVMHDGRRWRILPPALFLAALAAVVIGHLVWPLGRLVAWPWRLLGAAPLAAGVALNLLADGLFKRRATTEKPFAASSCLVTDGVFGLTRNPMYLGMALILAGLALLLGSLWPWLVTLGFAVLVQRLYIRHEETTLAEQFGEAWLAYRRRVRRWV